MPSRKQPESKRIEHENRKGSLRAIATAAELQGLVSHPSLPLPLRGLEGIEREELQSLLAKLELTE